MKVIATVTASLFAVGLTAGAACNSDQPRRAEGDVDGGVMMASSGGSDSPNGPNDGLKPDDIKDAGSLDAGSLAPDAGGGAVPTVAEMVDGGHMNDAHVATNGNGKPPKPVLEGGTGKDADKDGLNVVIWNRVMVKVKNKDLSPSDLQETVELATGAKVEKIRKTAGTFWLVQFAPTVPHRKQADQQKLIASLKSSGAFAIVEGDQIMKIKTP